MTSTLLNRRAARKALVTLGGERLLRSGRLAGRRVGIVCNPASIDESFVHIADAVRDAGATVVALFGPQHGIQSDVQENMIESDHAHDATRRIPVYSLYSETRQPSPQMLEGIELLLIDLQDVGTRIYTYIYTMANCLRAAATHGLEVVVCDRPNPIGGVAVEGPMLVRGFESFVGQYPIPMRHGMTIGELARFFNEQFDIGAKLEVITMTGWDRSMHFDDCGLPWVLPSPNIPTLDTAIVYPGTVLFEGVNISEGRGTTRPFELLGAPWIDAEAFATRMNSQGLPGAYFRPASFQPTFHKHAGQPCGGCQVHITDRDNFQPVLTGITLLNEFRSANPDKFEWRQPPYEYEYEKLPFDILAGSGRLREDLKAGVSPRTIAESWDPAVREFLLLRERFLLY